MRRWWLAIALLLSLGINIGLLASHALRVRSAPPETPAAGPPTEVPEPGHLPRVIQRMADELHLRGEKRKAFVDIQRRFFEETLAARGRMVRLQRQLRHEVVAEDPDHEALDALLIELSETHYELERAFVNNLIDSRELLDERQERRFMRFLRRMRQVRTEVERRFRERWQPLGERFDQRGPGGPGAAGRFGRGRAQRPVNEPPPRDEGSGRR